MGRSGDFLGSQHQDGAFDRPPAAEVDDIAEAAAAIRAQRGLAGGMLAERGDKIVGLLDGGAIGDMEMGEQGESWI